MAKAKKAAVKKPAKRKAKKAAVKKSAKRKPKKFPVEHRLKVDDFFMFNDAGENIGATIESNDGESIPCAVNESE